MLSNLRSSSRSSVAIWLTVCLHLTALLRPSTSQSCSSLGEHPQGSCSRSRSCRAENPTELEYAECAPTDDAQDPYALSLPAGVSWCQRSGFTYQHCSPQAPVNTTLVSDNAIESLSVKIDSQSFKNFAVNLSWSHAHNPTEGYEVRVRFDSALVECFCINDPDMRSLYLNNSLTYRYADADSALKIEVSPLVGQLADEEGDFAVGIATEWPRGCLEINHTEETCGLPRYGPPSDVSVYKHVKSDEAILTILWGYSTVYVQPTVFYIAVYNTHDSSEYFTFVVNNTNAINVRHLSPSKAYKVRVQPYVHCSGLADRVSTLGCGLWSKSTSPVTGSLPLLLQHVRKQGSKKQMKA